jgi:hypothetical protein
VYTRGQTVSEGQSPRNAYSALRYGASRTGVVARSLTLRFQDGICKRGIQQILASRPRGLAIDMAVVVAAKASKNR